MQYQGGGGGGDLKLLVFRGLEKARSNASLEATNSRRGLCLQAGQDAYAFKNSGHQKLANPKTPRRGMQRANVPNGKIIGRGSRTASFWAELLIPQKKLRAWPEKEKNTAGGGAEFLG